MSDGHTVSRPETVAIACPDCGTPQTIGPLPARGSARCPVCGNTLERTAGRSLGAALACSLAILLLLLPAFSEELMRAGLGPVHRETSIIAGFAELWREDKPLLTAMVVAFVLVIPVLRFALLATVLGALRLGREPGWLGTAFRWAEKLSPWAMLDVYLLGLAVAYSRMAPNLNVTIGAGGWCFLVAALLSMVAEVSFDRRTVWRRIGGEVAVPKADRPVACSACDLLLPSDAEGRRCPRCRARVLRRKPAALQRTAALVLAGFALYIPANLLPISVLDQLGQIKNHTITAGIELLVQNDLWPLAVLIFVVSICIPLVKLAALCWFLWSVRHRSRRRLVLKTRMHRVIDRLGHWSNMDPFIAAALAPLMNFGALANVKIGGGALPFALVVALTMLASHWFDPRLMWDVAEEGGA